MTTTSFPSAPPPAPPPATRVGWGITFRRSTPRLGNHPPFQFMHGLAAASLSSGLRTADILHSVGYYFFPAVLAHLLTSLYRTPHVCTPRSASRRRAGRGAG